MKDKTEICAGCAALAARVAEIESDPVIVESRRKRAEADTLARRSTEDWERRAARSKRDAEVDRARRLEETRADARAMLARIGDGWVAIARGQEREDIPAAQMRERLAEITEEVAAGKARVKELPPNWPHLSPAWRLHEVAALGLPRTVRGAE